MSVAGATSRSELEEQRDFLLTSLRDLEAERAAGDIEEADFLALRDNYTSRAAAVLRILSSMDRGTAEPSGVLGPATVRIPHRSRTQNGYG